MLSGAQPALASSHREAPLISDDPSADSTDFYMFRSPQTDAAAAGTVTFVANYWPMQEPGGGPNWVRFGDSVLYEIKIDNDGDAKEDITYQFRFTTQFKTAATSFLFSGKVVGALTDPNVVQTYTVTRVDKTGSTVLASNVQVPPPYMGDKTNGALATYSALALTAVGTLNNGGGKVFAGQRDDPFFADLGGIFDLVRVRCAPIATANTPDGCAGMLATANATKGVDFLAGYNVHSIVLQVPITKLTSDGSAPTVSSKVAILGSWTTASRQRVTIRRAPNTAAALAGVKTQDNYGQWVQVSRLGLPLINEVIVPVGYKDYYNTTPPSNDGALFTALPNLLGDPELANALKALYGNAAGTPGPGRTDLVNLVQFDIAGSAAGASIAPFVGKTYGLAPADILRMDVSLAAPLNQTVNPLGAIGVVFNAVADTNVGFPNGRRLQDDVVDVLERVVGGGILRGGVGLNLLLSDKVDANDRAFDTVFPYVPAPWSGSEVGIDTTNKLLHQFR
jgi:hypothetical protein